MQEDVCDLRVRINGSQEFFIDQRIPCLFSKNLSRMVNKEKRKGKTEFLKLEIVDFPAGGDGFELAARFCYGNGRIQMTPSNISLLHCAAKTLEMTEDMAPCNLLSQTETYLEGLFYWTWGDILESIKSCEPFVEAADESGLLQKLFSALVAKISCNSDIPILAGTPFASSSSSSSSPDACALRFSYAAAKTPESIRPCSGREWWFRDLAILSPQIIEKFISTLGAYGSENKNLILTRFLLHYLKTAAQKGSSGAAYGNLADTAVHGVVLMGKTAFSCRGLFWVLRVVSGLGLSKECRNKLEGLMGSMLDQATLDDLLVSGHDGGIYDVNLVLRLLRVFVSLDEGGVALQRMKKVGRLMDKYLREISPDQSLKVSKFLAIAESLPDSARDCFDGVFRALDIYLEGLSFEERSRLCRCINYQKLTLETCKELAKNPRIPPRSAVQALAAQRKKVNRPEEVMVAPLRNAVNRSPVATTAGKDETQMNLQMMQWRVAELEKVCREMKGQMSRMSKSGSKVNSSPSHLQGRGLPRLC